MHSGLAYISTRIKTTGWKQRITGSNGWLDEYDDIGSLGTVGKRADRYRLGCLNDCKGESTQGIFPHIIIAYISLDRMQ